MNAIIMSIAFAGKNWQRLCKENDNDFIWKLLIAAAT